MKTQISTSFSEKTRRKADALVNDGGYTYRELVSIGIDRLYTEWQERSTMSNETIQTIEWHVNLPDLWADEPEEGTDVEASERRYVEMVEAALQEAYPGVEIITHTHQATGWSRPASVNGLADTAECAAVDDVIGSVYQGWEWLVTA